MEQELTNTLRSGVVGLPVIQGWEHVDAVTKEITIASDLAHVWALVRDFAARPTAVGPWPVPPDTTLPCVDTDAPRTAAGPAQFRLRTIDPVRRRVVYSVSLGPARPLYGNAAISVAALGDNACKITWAYDVSPASPVAEWGESITPLLERFTRALEEHAEAALEGLREFSTPRGQDRPIVNLAESTVSPSITAAWQQPTPIGDLIRCIRRGILAMASRAELAAALTSRGYAVSVATVGRWETGESAPRPEALHVICELAGRSEWAPKLIERLQQAHPSAETIADRSVYPTRGRAFRAIRKHVLGMTQAELATALARTTRIIRHWEADDSRPDLDSLQAMGRLQGLAEDPNLSAALIALFRKTPRHTFSPRSVGAAPETTPRLPDPTEFAREYGVHQWLETVFLDQPTVTTMSAMADLLGLSTDTMRNRLRGKGLPSTIRAAGQALGLPRTYVDAAIEHFDGPIPSSTNLHTFRDLGAVIAALRARLLGMGTRLELAKALGLRGYQVSASSIGKWETCRARPSRRALHLMSDIAGRPDLAGPLVTHFSRLPQIRPPSENRTGR
ncbi:SRPBCC family protein [Nocardia sp. CA-290969]|uniref:SRPBCC family protein n=1 Tax=Nocardia sp. CA-290969 TaxID=3239986 RepID=UPI003D8E5596